MHLPNQRPGKPDKLSQCAHNQTSYPRVQWENTLDTKGLQNPVEQEEQHREAEQESRQHMQSQEGEHSSPIREPMEHSKTYPHWRRLADKHKV